VLGESVDYYISLSHQFTPHAVDEKQILSSAFLSNNYASAQKRLKRKVQRSMVCSTFLELSFINADRWLANMHSMTDSHCHWVFVIYKYRSLQEKDEIVEYMKQNITHRSSLSEHSIQKMPTYEFVFLPARHEYLIHVGKLCRSLQLPVQPDNRTHDFGSSSSSSSSSSSTSSTGRNGRNSSSLGADLLLEKTCDEIEHAATALSGAKINHIVYPKALMFIFLLPYVEQYRYIWILDGDLNLQGFNAKRFLQIWHCSFIQDPLIVQPVIAENTQTYKYLNQKSWTEHRDRVVAAHTGFVEIQAPVMDTHLFRFYVLSFVLPLVVPAHILGADWGFDQLFCNAAKLYDIFTSNYDTTDTEMELRNFIECKQNLTVASTIQLGAATKVEVAGGRVLATAAGAVTTSTADAPVRVRVPVSVYTQLASVRGANNNNTRRISASGGRPAVGAAEDAGVGGGGEGGDGMHGNRQSRRLSGQSFLRSAGQTFSVSGSSVTITKKQHTPSTSNSAAHEKCNRIFQSVLKESEPMCGLIVQGTPLHHINSKETNQLVGYSLKRAFNMRMLELLEKTFPNVYQSGFEAKSNPLVKRSHLQLVKHMRPGCFV